MQHLLILDYRTDAERKRIDYTIEKWAGRRGVSVAKPKGVVVLFEGEMLAEFVEDVYSRLDTGADPPKIYTLEAQSADVAKQTRQLAFATDRSAPAVEDFLNYLLAKQNAVLEYSDRAGRSYTARTRKGQVRIRVSIVKEKTVRCLVTVEGYGGAVDLVAGRIGDEMNVFLGGAGAGP